MLCWTALISHCSVASRPSSLLCGGQAYFGGLLNPKTLNAVIFVLHEFLAWIFA